MEKEVDRWGRPAYRHRYGAFVRRCHASEGLSDRYWVAFWEPMSHTGHGLRVFHRLRDAREWLDENKAPT